MYMRNLCIFFCSLFSLCTSAQDRRPNIIFILTDDHRYDGLGYFGNPLARTPELDAIARSGTVFRNAFSSTPICSASRASIFSGLQERTHRYGFQTDAILNRYMDSAYPVMLRKAGYRTAFFGKFGVKYDRKDLLFDVHEDYDRNDRFKDHRGYYYKKLGDDTVHLTRYTGQRGVDFIKNQTADRPFCLQLAFSAPHAHDGAAEQYFSDPSFDTLFQGMVVPPPHLSEDSFFQAEPAAVKAGFSRLRWTWRFDEPDKYQRMIKAYYRMIAEVDREVGLIRKALKDQGLDKNTVIIFMSDNGYFLGERGLADKWLMYEPSVRVPLVIQDPRKTRHREVDQQVLNIDVSATILDLAGVQRPPSWHGKSLKGFVQGNQTAQHRDTILLEHLWVFDQIPASEGIRTSGWKYFRYVDDQRLEFLFDLTKDPEEKINLAGRVEHQSKLRQFRTAFERQTAMYRDAYGDGPVRLSTTLDRLPEGAVAQTPQPIFQWNTTPASGKQRGYQLLVAGDRELLDRNIGDYWDTRQVRSGQTEQVGYMGKALHRGATYYWKVRVWDEYNRTTDYSKPESFLVW
jgi:arylsulfatase A-like enzyme